MNARVLFKSYFFRLDLGNIVENFEKSNNSLWGDFILVDFKREFISHCMKEAVYFGLTGSHSYYIFYFSVGGHDESVL